MMVTFFTFITIFSFGFGSGLLYAYSKVRKLHKKTGWGK